MPDDAIERARECLAGIFADRDEWATAVRICNLDAPLADCEQQMVDRLLAFASQQAPGMVLVPRVCPEPWLTRAKKLLGADAAEAQIIWSAMLDAAPSVTLGGVG